MLLLFRSVILGKLDFLPITEHARCAAIPRCLVQRHYNYRSVDGEAQKLLKTLRDEKLPAKMPESNIVRFKVEWGGKEGIDMETHKVRTVYKARYT